jgi:hypothetical protein
MRRSRNNTETLSDHSGDESGRKNDGFGVRFEEERGRVEGRLDPERRSALIDALASLLVEDLIKHPGVRSGRGEDR